MVAFDYHEPASLTEAFALLDAHGQDAHVFAGGTALVLLMRLGLIAPAHVVSLRRIGDLREIGILPTGGLEIGALVTHAEVERSALVQRFFAPLAQTFGRVATVRVRNQATVGGNIAHADPASDPPPMLMALDADVAIASRAGSRTLPVHAFFTGIFETALAPGEIVTAIRIPPPASGTRGTYVKFLPASQDDFATVSVAATLRTGTSGKVEHVRLALGSVGMTPLRARRAEDALLGRTLTAQAIADATALVREEVNPLSDARGTADYKRKMAVVWTRRALEGLRA